MNPDTGDVAPSDDGPRLWMIVPAAGTGRRFSDLKAKQFFDLCGETVAQRCLYRLLQVPDVARLIVPCDLRQATWSEIPASSDPRVELISGGATRAESVANGLRAIDTCADPMDWVLVHDIARPCIALESIAKLRREVDRHPVGGILVAPIADTLKAVSVEGAILHTADRVHFRLAQTPQMFRYGELTAALAAAAARALVPTDEASALEYAARPMLAVEGRRDNIKITCSEDLIMAAAILTAQENPRCV